MTYLYDGTYEGFLTCIFETFERKVYKANVAERSTFVHSMFEESVEVITDNKKCMRVRKGLEAKVGKIEANNCWRVFLFEESETINLLFNLILRIFTEGGSVLSNFGDKDVLNYHQTLKKVNRERHRMQAFIRFQKTKDGMYFALIEPDFNVLPLLINFFKNRYTDQKWLIYDVKRKYGMMYDKVDVSEVTLSENQTSDLNEEEAITLEDEELYYQGLWKQYFKSTNIVQRKNMKLHLRHVPKRYWKYLIEKQ